MTKLIKWILVLALLLVVLLVVGGVLLVTMVDPNDYKEEIAQAVKEETGRELVYEGDIKLSVFPWLGMEVGALELGNAPGFGDKPFAKVQSASVSIKLVPLLSKQVEMGTVSLHGLTLNLMRDKSGKTNWDDLAKGKDKPAEEPAAPEGEAQDGGAVDMTLAVEGLEVKDANILWDDRKENKRYALKNVNLDVSGFEMGKPFDMVLAFGLDSAEPKMAADINLKGVVSFDLERKKYGVSGFDLKVAAKGDTLPGGSADVALGATEIKADLENQVATIAGLTLSTMGIEANGAINAEKIMDAPNVKGTIKVEEFNLRDVLAKISDKPLATADPQAMKSVGAALDFQAGKDSVNVSKLVVRLDETTVNATMGIKSFKKPAYMFRANVDQIDADRYLPPKAKKGEGGADSGSAPAPAEGGSKDEAKLPVDMIKKLNLDGELKIQALKINGLSMSDVLVKVMARDGVLNVQPASLKMYEGDVNTALTMNVQGQVPKTNIMAKVAELKLGPMLKDMNGKESLTGTMNLNTAMTTLGDKPSAMKKTLNGNLAFDIHDGVFPGVDLAGLMEDAGKMVEKGLTGDLSRGEEEDAKTRFGLIKATAKITNGLIANDDFLMQSPFIRAEGKGTANLVTEAIDYKAVGALVATTKGQGGKSKDELYGVGVPIYVAGTFKNPKYGVDMLEYGKMILRGGGNIASDILTAPGDAVESLGKAIIGDGGPVEKPTDGGEAAPADKKEGEPEGLVKDLKSLF